MERNNGTFAKNGDLINFNNFTNRVVVITPDIMEITFTSEGKSVYGAITVKKRKEDLTINITDLSLNSGNEICIDFRTENSSDCKSTIVFRGSNFLVSENNIGICITKNNNIEISGDENGCLTVKGGTSKPAIGSNEYTEGNGHLVISGGGKVELKGGDGYKSLAQKEYGGKSGAAAISFYCENELVSSTVKIVDSVSLKATGGSGDVISSVLSENCGGCGGAAINIGKNGYFEKSSIGEMELQGGDGGECIGEYKCGASGNGGNAIELEYGVVKIYEPSILKGGKGGSIDSKNKNVISKGGNGGDCICILNGRNRMGIGSKLIIDNFIEGRGGYGGNSGLIFVDNKLMNEDGGNGGAFINSNGNSVDCFMGSVIFMEGEGGISGTQSTGGVKGLTGKLLKGENIRVSEFSIYKEEAAIEKEEVQIEDEVEEIVENEKVEEIVIKEKVNEKSFFKSIIDLFK